ncbi:MAG: PAS domain S-box protein [Myxococcaceae bacterium]
MSVCFGLALVAAVGVRAHRHSVSRDETAAWVSHAHAVLETLDGLLLALDDAVGFRRGFALSGDTAQLGPYRAAIERVSESRSALRRLATDSPELQRRLDTLEPLLTARVAQLESHLRPASALPFDARGEGDVTSEGNAQSMRIRELVSALAEDERRLLAERERGQALESAAVRATLLVGFGVSVAVLLLAFVLLLREISRRGQAERALALREQRTAITLKSIAEGVLATDAGGAVVQMNPAAEQLTGWPLAEAAGQPFTTVVSLLDETGRTAEPHPVSRVLASGGTETLGNHTVLVSRQGTETPVAYTAAPILDAVGRPEGAVLTFRDVTASQASEARFRRLLEAAPDAILITDAAGRITMANTQVTSLFGYWPDELVGRPIEVLIPERLHAQHAQHRAAYRAAPTVRAMGAGLPLFARRKDGAEFPVEISLSPVVAGDGSSVIAAVRDVSRRHALERFREEYLEFISHDLKKPSFRHFPAGARPRAPAGPAASFGGETRGGRHCRERGLHRPAAP